MIPITIKIYFQKILFQYKYNFFKCGNFLSLEQQIYKASSKSETYPKNCEMYEFKRR